MKYIYYPEYELEYRNLLVGKRPQDHILNIRLLMFLCDHVILPPSHLLYTSYENIESLISELQTFFYVGKIVTTRYRGGIDSYLDSRLERMQDPVFRNEKKRQANRIRMELLFNDSVEHNRSDEKTQLSLFDKQVRTLIRGSSIPQEQSHLLMNRMDTLSNATGEPVYSNQFRRILAELSDNRAITEEQNRALLNLMSGAYYYSGTYTMDTLVSYNGYFNEIGLHESLRSTHERATNLIVDPYFLRRLFAAIGIDTRDIFRLSAADYREIMSHRYWGNFMALFERLYSDAQALDELLRHRTGLETNYQKRKENLRKCADILNNDFVKGILLSSFAPGVGVGLSVAISAVKRFVPPVGKFDSFLNDYVADKILFLINQSKDPLYEFSYRLNSVIRELSQEHEA